MNNEKVESYFSSGNLIITESETGNGGSVQFGVDDDGLDVIFRGATSGAYVQWDESADTLKFVGGATIDGGGLTSYALTDDVDLEFGDGTDVTMQWDTAATPDEFQVLAAADDTVFRFGVGAATQKSFDLIWLGGQANGASSLTMDASADLIYTTGVDIQIKDNDILVIGSGSGANGDVQFVWDATNLITKAIADDTLWEIGDSAATQLSFDIKWYAGQNSGASYLYFDASADLIYTTGVDLQFKDADLLVFGTGAGATGDVQMQFDGTTFIISATADDTVIEIGDAAATQLSFDVKVYGNAANGADYLLADAGASKLTTAGAYYIAGRVDDANGIGIAASVKSTTGDPGTTGTPAGSLVFNSNDNELLVYTGAAWIGAALS